jgi:hypothetical protein
MARGVEWGWVARVGRDETDPGYRPVRIRKKGKSGQALAWGVGGA